MKLLAKLVAWLEELAEKLEEENRSDSVKDDNSMVIIEIGHLDADAARQILIIRRDQLDGDC